MCCCVLVGVGMFDKCHTFKECHNNFFQKWHQMVPMLEGRMHFCCWTRKNETKHVVFSNVRHGTDEKRQITNGDTISSHRTCFSLQNDRLTLSSSEMFDFPRMHEKWSGISVFPWMLFFHTNLFHQFVKTDCVCDSSGLVTASRVAFKQLIWLIVDRQVFSIFFCWHVLVNDPTKTCVPCQMINFELSWSKRNWLKAASTTWTTRFCCCGSTLASANHVLKFWESVMLQCRAFDMSRHQQRHQPLDATGVGSCADASCTTGIRWQQASWQTDMDSSLREQEIVLLRKRMDWELIMKRRSRRFACMSSFLGHCGCLGPLWASTGCLRSVGLTGMTGHWRMCFPM